MSTIPEIKVQVRPCFDSYPIDKVFLFGSRARQDAKDSSDIDFLIHLSPNHNLGLFEWAELKLLLQEKLQCTVDCVSSSSVSPYILPYINKDKILIYAKETGR